MEESVKKTAKETAPDQYSPLALAFLGDAVYSLYIREKLLGEGNRPAARLHALAASHVKADAQAALMAKILPRLTEEEARIYRRGRNAHPGHKPRGASPAAYQEATAFETLVGWLYLSGRTERFYELVETAPDEGA